MNGRAAAWVDGLFPRVPVRQWVLTVPWKRRLLLAREPTLARGVLDVALGVITRWYAKQASAPDGRTGSVTVLQRFGSALNLNLHYHGILLDGVYVRDAKGALRFRPVTPHTSDVEALVVEIATACEAWLAKKGHGPDDEPPEPDADDGQAVIQWASVEGRQAVADGRPVRKVRKVQILGGREVAMSSRTAGCGGYNLYKPFTEDAIAS